MSQEGTQHQGDADRASAPNLPIKLAGGTAFTTRSVDISSLDEEELLGMIQGYMKSMLAFAEANRNVHKELKTKLKYTRLVLFQFVGTRNTRVKPRTSKPSHEQVDIDTATDKSAKPPAESSAATNIIIDMIKMQGEAIDKLTCHVESIRLQQQDKMDEMSERGIQTTWTDVVRSKGKKKDQGGKPADKPAAQGSSQRRGTRPPAIMVNASKKDFPALAQRIR